MTVSCQKVLVFVTILFLCYMGTIYLNRSRKTFSVKPSPIELIRYVGDKLQSPIFTQKDAMKTLNLTQDVAVKNISEIATKLDVGTATSGRAFVLKKTRTFVKEPVDYNQETSKWRQISKNYDCRKWGVMTTIFQPKEALRRFLYMKKWCVVIVGDLKKPEHFNITSTLGQNLIFLNGKDQADLGCSFVNALPWNSFARKNVGYLYAIAQDAEVIWDFDDDNILKFFIKDATPDVMLDIDHISDLVATNEKLPVSSPCSKEECLNVAFNPYPFLGCPTNPCWPRGFPMSLISNKSSTGELSQINISAKTIGVLQSLADHEPDVDAIFRQIMKTPFDFDRCNRRTDSILILPCGRFTPFNAQATLFFKNAYWGLYLPFSVHGRVSDIWRSYVVEAISSLFDIRVGFLPRPLVTQDRNEHALKKDFNAETALYKKTESLLDLLRRWMKKVKNEYEKPLNIMILLEDLYITLYEYEFIKLEDVTGVRKWLGALSFIGYAFGKVKQEKLHVQENIKSFNIGKPVTIPEPIKSCVNFKTRKVFWSSDLHDGTRVDIASQLQHLNQTVLLGGHKGATSPYPEVFKLPGVEVVKVLSQQIMKYTTHSYRMRLDEPDLNYQFYKDQPVMKNVDAFFCAFPASMCELWVPFNKSFVIMAAHRFNLGRCLPDDFHRWHDLVTRLSRDKRHIVSAMSTYDYQYMKYYLNLKNMYLLSSLSGFYTKGHDYKPSLPQILFAGHSREHTQMRKENLNVVPIHSLYGHYMLSDLVKHPAIVYMPYSVMSYKLTEFYSLAIPLFMPSMKFLKNHNGLGSDRTMASAPYCGRQAEVTKNMKKHPDSYHTYSPNLDFAEDKEAELYWLQLSDFFDWPYIQHFDNFTHLAQIYKSADLKAISEGMKLSYKIREAQTMETWCQLIPNISK